MGFLERHLVKWFVCESGAPVLEVTMGQTQNPASTIHASALDPTQLLNSCNADLLLYFKVENSHGGRRG